MEIVGKLTSWSFYCDDCGNDTFLNEHNPVCGKCHSPKERHRLFSETQWILYPRTQSPLEQKPKMLRRIYRKVVA